MVDVMLAADSLHLIGQEMLNGSLCYIVEAKTKYGTFTVWITPEKGYNALKYVNHRSGRDILKDDSCLLESTEFYATLISPVYQSAF